MSSPCMTPILSMQNVVKKRGMTCKRQHQSKHDSCSEAIAVYLRMCCTCTASRLARRHLLPGRVGGTSGGYHLVSPPPAHPGEDRCKGVGSEYKYNTSKITYYAIQNIAALGHILHASSVIVTRTQEARLQRREALCYICVGRSFACNPYCNEHK